MRRFINGKLRRMAHSAEEGQALLTIFIWSGFGLTVSLWAMIFGIFLPAAQRF